MSRKYDEFFYAWNRKINSLALVADEDTDSSQQSSEFASLELRWESVAGLKGVFAQGGVSAPFAVDASAPSAATVAEGGETTIAGPGTQTVSFAGSSGALVIEDPQAFQGVVSGLSGSDTIDLSGFAFSADAQATFVGTQSGGTLTVSNGVETAEIALTGDYMSSTWSLSSDGNGGANVVDPPLASNWQMMKVGAGGWAVGLDEAADGTIVVRTDTNGAYLWNGSSWQQLVTASSLPAAYIAANPVSSGQGVYEIQMAPSNSSIMYMMFNGYIFVSNDKGATWSQTSFAQVSATPNNSFRMYGQKMAVDPNNSNIVYVGTPQNGLWVTNDGGNTWAKVSAVPVSGASNGQYPGITGIVFDTGLGGVANGVTQTIFASSYGNGVYESTNGGSTWTHLAGGPANVEYATASTNGAYYVAGDNNQNLWRYYNGAWTKLLAGNGGQGVQAIVINPNNLNEIVAVAQSGYLNVSYNGGTTWSGIDWSVAVNSADIPWEKAAQLASGGSMYLSVGGAAFSKSTPNKLILSTGTGSFDVMVPTTSLTSALVYNDMSVGIENLVANEILVAPGGSPILASWDRPFIKITDLNNYPTTYGPVASNAIVAGWSVDYASSTPSFLVGIADWWGVEESGYSTDGGTTWTKFSTELAGGGASFIGGTIAASTTQNFIWAPADGNKPYYTLNGGQTWNPITLPGVTNWSNFDWAYYLTDRTVTADRVLANTFYLYYPGTNAPGAGAGVFETVNGGQTWTEVYNGAPAPWATNSEIMSAPGQAGNLFLTAGIQGDGTSPPSYAQFMMSTNQGKTWTAVANVLGVSCFGFGAAAPGQTYPSIYIVGYVNNVYGIWQSTNKAQSWTQIGTIPAGELDTITTISGDPNVFGRAYVGFQGGGYAYLSGGPYVTGVTTNPSSGVLTPGTAITFTVNMSSTVTVAGGGPTLNLNDGGVATYVSGSGSGTLTFAYTVSSSDTAVNALAISSTSLNGATIQDASGDVATLTGAVTTFSTLSVIQQVSVASYLANQTALDAIGDITIVDTAAAVASAIDTINADANVSEISLQGSTNLNLSVAQALSDTRALNAIDGPFGVTITDTGANVSANFDALNTDNQITTILPTDGSQTMTLSLTQITNDTHALALLDPFIITVQGAAASLNSLSLAKIANFAANSVNIIEATDVDLSLSQTQRAALGAAGISVEQPYTSGTMETFTYNANGVLSTAFYQGLTGRAYTSYSVNYGPNGSTSATYSNGMTAVWTYNANGSYSLTSSKITGQPYSADTFNYGTNKNPISAKFNNGMTETWNYNADGSSSEIWRGVTNATNIVTECIFDATNTRVATALDMNDGTGRLSLLSSGLTVSSASGALKVSAGADTFALDPHTTEVINASGGSSEVFKLSSGFGQATITNFAAGGAGGDVLSLSLSMFSGLSAAKTVAQDVAFLLSSSALTSSGSNAILTDAHGDTLTLMGVATTGLSQNAASVFRFA